MCRTFLLVLFICANYVIPYLVLNTKIFRGPSKDEKAGDSTGSAGKK